MKDFDLDTLYDVLGRNTYTFKGDLDINHSVTQNKDNGRLSFGLSNGSVIVIDSIIDEDKENGNLTVFSSENHTSYVIQFLKPAKFSDLNL